MARITDSKTKNYKEAADFLKSIIKTQPSAAIVCGSGLGGLAETIEGKEEISYEKIPHFKQITVAGHCGKLVFGKLQGVSVVCMVGRFHYYEGYSMDEITFPIRVFHLLGVKSLLVTNASGSLNPAYKSGDVMIISDHINLVGMTGINPLVGPNLNEFGPRFPAMTETYDKKMRSLLKKAALDASINERNIHEGVYVCISGPNYESKAEARFLRMIGADAVGMSTIPEVLVGKHCGMTVCGLALITNQVITSEEQNISPPNHEEVLQASKSREKDLESLVKNFFCKLK